MGFYRKISMLEILFYSLTAIGLAFFIFVIVVVLYEIWGYDGS
jgi:hypothetical protein